MSKKIAIRPDVKLVADFVYEQEKLPTDKPVIQYIRQSTSHQLKKNKQSWMLQDTGLRHKLVNSYGWNETLVIPIDDDQGKSGTKRRDERVGLDRLYRLIETGQAGCVAAFDVSRLYRVFSRAEYGRFVDMCVEYSVPVITDSRIFWPNKRADMDALMDEFRAAAAFIEDIVKGKLIKAKNRHIQEDASWGGHSVPVGYTIACETRPDGTTRKYYTEYQPHAELVRWLFRRFRELNGNLALLHRELHAKNFHFPDFQPGYEVHIALPHDDQGYRLTTRAAILSLLTNRAYIGNYEYGGRVARNAHDSIVSLDDFLYAYERLSMVDTDGNPYDDRPVRERRYGGATALLDSVVTSDNLNVYVVNGEYVSRDYDNGWKSSPLVVDVALVDTAFADALVGTLNTLETRRREGLAADVNRRVRELATAQQDATNKLDKQLAKIDKELRQSEESRAIAKEEEDWTTYREETRQIVALNRDKIALEAQREQASSEGKDWAMCIDLIDQATHQWGSMTRELQKRLVRLIVDSANITAIAPHFLRLDVYLSEPVACHITVHMFRACGSRVIWTTDETVELKRMYANQSKQAILAALPTHTWNAICQRARELGLRRVCADCFDIPVSMTYADYLLMDELNWHSLLDGVIPQPATAITTIPANTKQEPSKRISPSLWSVREISEWSSGGASLLEETPSPNKRHPSKAAKTTLISRTDPA
jgi:DNA invertase Pin-like site-specific DNA recombinase